MNSQGIEGIENYVDGKWIIVEGKRFYAAKSQIEKDFFSWICQHPESFHPLNMKRFYQFTKSFCRHKRKNKNSLWLREKISSYEGHELSNNQIVRYCDLFDDLIKFYNIL